MSHTLVKLEYVNTMVAGDEYKVKAYNHKHKTRTPFCSCVGRGSDDSHKQECAFWQHIMKARDDHKPLYSTYLCCEAFGCRREMEGQAACKYWCGQLDRCLAALVQADPANADQPLNGRDRLP